MPPSRFSSSPSPKSASLTTAQNHCWSDSRTGVHGATFKRINTSRFWILGWEMSSISIGGTGVILSSTTPMWISTTAWESMGAMVRGAAGEDQKQRICWLGSRKRMEKEPQPVACLVRRERCCGGRGPEAVLLSRWRRSATDLLEKMAAAVSKAGNGDGPAGEDGNGDGPALTCTCAYTVSPLSFDIRFLCTCTCHAPGSVSSIMSLNRAIFHLKPTFHLLRECRCHVFDGELSCKTRLLFRH